MKNVFVVLCSLFGASVIALAQSGSADAMQHNTGQSGMKQSQKRSDGIIVVQTLYYALPGKENEVLVHRQHVSDVLEKMGLPRGRVMSRVRGSDEDPDVTWECEFPDLAAFDHFLEVEKANAEFVEARNHMGTLIRKGELRIWEVQEPSGKRQ